MKKILFIIINLLLSYNGLSQNVTFQNYDGFLSIGTQSNRTASITLVDIDKDGDLDALIANGRHWAEQNYIYYNNGKGSFKKAQQIGGFLDASYSIIGADLNNDGIMDIAVVNDKTENKIYFGIDKYTYKNGISFGNPNSPSRNLEVLDIDKDGDLDLIISNRKSENEICLNDGKGNFEQILNFGNKTDQTIQTKIVDINNDGFFDLVTAERKSKNKVYLNDGNQNFSKIITFGNSNNETRSIEISDINKDGYLDVVTGNLGSENIIYYGDKNLIFNDKFTFKAKRMTTSLKIADINQDGIMDVIVGNSEQPNYVYLGNNNGNYIEVLLEEKIKADTYNIKIGDLNNDGLLDVIESNSGELNMFYITKKKPSKERLNLDSLSIRRIDSTSINATKTIVLANSIDFLQPNIKFAELILSMTEIDYSEFIRFKILESKINNDSINIKPLESVGNPEKGGYFILKTKKNRLKFICGENYTQPCYIYGGFIKALNSYSIGQFGEGIYESFLLDRNNNSIFYPGYEYDHGSYGLSISPRNEWLMASSSIDYDTYKDYYDCRSYIVIYDIKSIQNLSDIKNAYVYKSKDWEINSIYWINTASFVLEVYDKTKLDKNGSKIPINMKYLKVAIK